MNLNAISTIVAFSLCLVCVAFDVAGSSDPIRNTAINDVMDTHVHGIKSAPVNEMNTYLNEMNSLVKEVNTLTKDIRNPVNEEKGISEGKMNAPASDRISTGVDEIQNNPAVNKKTSEDEKSTFVNNLNTPEKEVQDVVVRSIIDENVSDIKNTPVNKMNKVLNEMNNVVNEMNTIANDMSNPGNAENDTPEDDKNVPGSHSSITASDEIRNIPAVDMKSPEDEMNTIASIMRNPVITADKNREVESDAAAYKKITSVEDERLAEKVVKEVLAEDSTAVQRVADFSASDIVSMTLEHAANSEVASAREVLEGHGITAQILFNARNIRGIQLRSQLPSLKDLIQEQIRTQYTMMNINVAFKLLGKVGELLRVAYAGCKGFPCSVPVITVNSKYQDLIFDSTRTSGYFVKTVIRALRYHKYAIRSVEKYQNLVTAKKWLNKCADLAGRLVIRADRMVNQSEVLKEMTVKAIEEASRDDVSNTQDIKGYNASMAMLRANVSEIHTLIQRLNGADKALAEKVNKLEAQVKEYQQKHSKIVNRKLKTREECTVTKVCKGTTFWGRSKGEDTVTVCNTLIDSEDAKDKSEQLKSVLGLIKIVQESKVRELETKNKIQQRMTALYGELAHSMENLKFSKATTNELLLARRSLEIAHQTLAIAKTIFLHNVNFWKAISDSAQEKANKDEILEVVDETIYESGINWLTMGKVCSDAFKAMLIIRKNVTNSFINLPTHKQAQMVVESSTSIIEETQALIKQINSNYQTTQKQLEEAKKELAKKPVDPDVDGDDDDDDDDDDIDDLMREN